MGKMLTDSHAHLDMEEFAGDFQEILDRALEEGVTRIVTIGIDMKSSVRSIELAQEYSFIFPAVGYHPHNTDEMEGNVLKGLKELASNPNVVALGEIGLDFFRDYAPRDKQIRFFEEQMRLANEMDLPVIIHDREAHDQVLEVLKKHLNRHREYKGVIHCFSGDYDLAMEFIKMGFFISIPGTVTYQKAYNVRDVASRIPLERMLVETDAPFLAPVPKRGRRNEPSYVVHTAKEVARLRDDDFEKVARITTENAQRLFGIA